MVFSYGVTLEMTSADGTTRESHLMNAARKAALLLVLLSLSGCGLVAAPCRILSAGLKILPMVGHTAAAPTDACAAAIDP
jgi:hypothetical protein